MGRGRNWQDLLESISESVNDELRLRHAYLLAEHAMLCQQINGRVQCRDSDRQELAARGITLGKKALEESATVAKADTMLACNRQFAAKKGATCELPEFVGRSRVDTEIEALVVRMARLH